MASAIGAVESPGRLRHWWRAAVAHVFRIRYRLLLINVVVVAVPVVGIAFARLHEGQLMAALERDMIHQAQLLRAALLDDPAGLRLTERGPMLADAARYTRTRIRLLDATGTLAADSHATGPPEGAEAPTPELLGGSQPYHAAEVPNPVALGERPEVQAALAGHYGAATRLWPKQQRVYLFAALPIETPVRSIMLAPFFGGVRGVIYVTRSTQPVKLQLYRLRSWLGKVLIASLAFTAVLSLFLAATIARPLTRLTRIAERIAAGDRIRRLTLARRDEIGQLARAVDRMTEELDRRARDMRDLAADISHEFKSPLTGIRGAAELLRDGAAEDPAARTRFLTMILDDAARLDRLVMRLLELSRAESDDSAVETVDLVALARSAAETAGGAAAVEVIGDARADVTGRWRALASAIENLVGNAVQHAVAGTVVTIDVRHDRRTGRTRLAVHNHGEPLSVAVQARVWDRFFTTRAAHGGSGLGLAIVRSVIATHGGQVGVASDAAGVTFWFELPSP